MELLHRYQLVRKIASGGMADIFLALQWGDGVFVREVAIKRMHRHHVEDARLLRMFQEEARLLALLRHGGFPHVYDCRRADDAWYIAMEYVRGPSLRQLFEAAARDGQATPFAVALSIIAGTADALHYAHELRDRNDGPLGLVHGDLNPDNVIVGVDGLVKIIDLGVAVTSSNDTQTDGLRGSLRYMAPEQARSEGLFDRRADVYGLGILLFELTTGRRLYEGDDVRVLTRLIEEDVPAPSSVRSDYPRELEPMVLASLARDPRHRLESTAALSRALHAYARGHGMSLGPDAIAEHVKAVWPATADPPVRLPAEPPDFVNRGEAIEVEVEAVSESEPPPAPTLDDLEHHEVLRDLSVLDPDAGDALRRDLFPSAHAVRPPSAPPATQAGGYSQPGSAERVFRRPSEFPPRK